MKQMKQMQKMQKVTQFENEMQKMCTANPEDRSREYCLRVPRRQHVRHLVHAVGSMDDDLPHTVREYATELKEEEEGGLEQLCAV